MLPILESKPSLGRAVDTDVICVFQGRSKKAIAPKGPYGAVVEKLGKQDSFSARNGSVLYLRFGGKGGAQNALLVGLGQAGELTEEKMRQAGGHAWAKLVSEKAKAVSVRVDSFSEAASGNPRLIRAFAEGMILGAYHFKKYKAKVADEKYHAPSRVTFLVKEKFLKAAADRHIAEVRAMGEAVTVTRDWSNEPSNIGTPEYFAHEAKRIAKEHGLKCTILNEGDAAKEKMGLFIGVGQGAEREGRIVVLEYVPSGAGTEAMKTVALVGKGVTFDSGGVSIKPSLRMEEMKHDMTGAATVMGAMILLSRWKVKNRVIGVMAFTENMPDGNAIQPGNVLNSRAGKTVEVINTDAEGRLILADVLDYAQDMKPDVIVDIATLTGAVSVALGKYCCGLLGNDDGLMESLVRAGNTNGERLWQLPLYDEYFDDLKSDVADMKNSANDGNGGTIRGAIFLKQFIRKGTRWAHLDIAATAWNQAHLAYFPKRGASGSYVRTLAQLASDL